MLRVFILLLAASTVFAGGDPWAKVRELKSGAEIRLFKRGTVQPLLAKFGELTPDSVVIILKNEQVAVARELVDRLDYRPTHTRVSTETRTTSQDPQARLEPGPNQGNPTTSTVSSVAIASRGEFETIYRRPPPTPKK